MDSTSRSPDSQPKPVPARSGVERRRNPRYACVGFVEVVVNEAEFLFRGEIRDISSTGCYVSTNARQRMKRGQYVDVYFHIENDQVKCQARIIDLRPGKGVGLEFTELTERARRTIRSLIRRLEEAATENSKPAHTS